MKTTEARDERALIPKSVTCPRCHARIDVAKSWDAARCACGKILRLAPWRLK